jgi:preprotein translocase subunit SecG
MSTLFWVGIVLHVLLCLFLVLLVLIQNDKMGGLAGLGGMTTQSAFSTAGAATFIQKLTRIVAIFFFILVFALSFIASRQNNEGSVSDLRESATQTQASEVVVPELPSAVPVAPAPQATEPAAAPAAP